MSSLHRLAHFLDSEKEKGKTTTYRAWCSVSIFVQNMCARVILAVALVQCPIVLWSGTSLGILRTWCLEKTLPVEAKSIAVGQMCDVQVREGNRKATYRARLLGIGKNFLEDE